MRVPLQLPLFPSVAVIFLALHTCILPQAKAQTPAVMQRSSLFVSAPALPLDGSPNSLVSGDLNGDGKLDLVTADSQSGKITVSLGLGQGNFSVGTTFDAGPHPGSILLADVDGDGHLDLIVVNTTADTVSILQGTGDGRFLAPVAYPLGFHPRLLATGDFSGQGRADIVVTDSASGRFALLTNNEGHYGAPALHALTAIASAMTVADLNGDGHPDLAFAGVDGRVNILLNRQGSLYTASTLTPANTPISAILASDFNHDGIADLALAIPGTKQLAVLSGNGDGSFASPVFYSVGGNPAAILSADLDEDGAADLIAANQGSNTFSVLMGKGDGSFGSAQDFVTGRGPVAFAVGDFYQDGHIGVAVLNHDDATITVPRGNGDGTFRAARAYTVNQQPRSVVSGDLAGNHRPDLVVSSSCESNTSCTHGTASVLIAGDNGSYHFAGSYPLGAGPVALALADMDGDKKQDIVALNHTDHTVSIFSGLGSGNFQQAYTLSLASAPLAIAIADFNNDGRPDLAIIGDCGTSNCSQPGTLEIFYGAASGSFRSGPSYPLGYMPSAIAIADINGDKHLDIVVANRCGKSAACNTSGSASVFLGTTSEQWKAGADLDLGKSPSSIALADLGSRGTSDLVVSHDTENTVTTLRGNGDGTFQAATSYPAGASPNSLAVADFNGDGHLDIAVSNHQDATVSVFYGKGDGTLVANPALSVGAGPASLAILAVSSKLHAGLVTANADAATANTGSQVTVLANLQPEGVGTTASSTAITASSATATVGDLVTLTAVVTGDTTDGAPAGGSVTFDSTPDAIADCNGTASNIVTIGVTAGDTTTFACKTHMLQAPSQTINATYSGDTTYESSSSATAATVTVSPLTTATLALTPSSTTIALNSSVTFTASLTGIPANGPTPNGTVHFLINGTANTTLCPDAPVATPAACTLNTLTVNHGTVTATYSGDTNYTVSNTATSTVTVQAITAPLSLAFSATPTVGQNVTITVSIPAATAVSPIAPTAAPVFLVNGAAPVVNGPLSQCTSLSFTASTHSWTCITTFPKALSYNIGVSYPSSDPNFSLTSASSSVTIGQANNLTLALVASPSSAYVNQAVTYTATLSPSNAQPAPTGNITFTDQTTNQQINCSPAAVSSGVATCVSTPYITASTVKIKAVYQGDDYYASGANATATVTVAADPTVTTVKPTFPSTSQVNQSVQFSATVAASAAVTNATGGVIPQGSIAFTATPTTPGSPITLCTGTVNAGVATCSQPFPTTGTFTVNAAFTSSSTAQFASSSSTSGVTQTVNAAGTPITLSPTANSIPVNQAMTFTATITYTGTAPTGTVTYTDNSVGNGGTPLCVIDLTANPLPPNGTVASCKASFSSAGQHAVTANYSGDALYLKSSSAVSSINVNSGTIVFSNITPSNTGVSSSLVDQVVAFSATISQTASENSPAPGFTVAYPTGTVTFGYVQNGAKTTLCTATLSGTSSDTAACSAPYIAAGTYNVVLSYLPGADGNFSAAATSSSAAQLHTVNPAPVAVTIASSTQTTAAVYQPLAFAVTVAPQGVSDTGLTVPTGSVTFKTAAGTLCTTPPIAADGTAACAVPNGQASIGNNQVTAYYAGDNNFVLNNSAAQPLTITADPTTASLVADSPNNTIIATRQVIFNASFTPTYQPPTPNSAPPTGTITFTIQPPGAASLVTLCTGAGSWAAGALTASCKYPSTVTDQGSYPVTATYVPGTPNFGQSGMGLTEIIQNFMLTFAPAYTAPATSAPVYVTQGYSTYPAGAGETVDPFTSVLNPTAPLVTAQGIAGLIDSVSSACKLTFQGTTSSQLVLPGCSPSTAVLNITAANTQPVAPATGSYDFSTTVQTTPGKYQVQFTGTDGTASQLTHTYTPFTLYVVPQAGQITLSAGFSGSETVTFATAQTLQFNTNACPSIMFSSNSGTTWSQATGGNGITCSVTSQTASSSSDSSTVAVTVTTTGPGQSASAAVRSSASSVALAALGGVPLFAALAWFGGRRSPCRNFFRFLGVLILLFGIGNAIGCGGGGFTLSGQPHSGTTYGNYLVQVTGTDPSTGISYYAVVPLSVPAPASAN
jgi:hypothetical protein